MELPVSSILTGLLIGVSGAIYLGSGKAPFGAVLFSVASSPLVPVAWRCLPPALGICDVERSSGLREEIGGHLAGNLIGCTVTALAVAHAKPAYREMACGLTAAKPSESPVQTFLFGVMCGLLMLYWGRSLPYLAG